METLVRPPDTEYLAKSEHLKAYDDVVTQFSELVDGSMRTSFDLYFDGSELYGRDGRGMGEITLDAIDDAEKIVKSEPDLYFESRRRALEREEYLLLVEMAKGNGSNTMVVVSDFPAELVGAKEDVGGYNVTRQQTMLRVLTRQKNGSIKMFSQSLDGSDRKSLEAIYEHYGVKPEPGELLGQRINVDLGEYEQENVVDQLTGVYDRSMSLHHGGDWYAGRRPADYRNTYEFVCAQQDIVDKCVDLVLVDRLDARSMYDMAATMQKRFKSGVQTSGYLPTELATQFSPPAIELVDEIKLAGMEARSSGQSFSACGSTLKAEGLDKSLGDQLEEAGYGNKIGEDKFGAREFRCKYGHWNKRPYNEKIKDCRVKSCKKGSVGC